jgi:hypothetical protein
VKKYFLSRILLISILAVSFQGTAARVDIDQLLLRSSETPDAVKKSMNPGAGSISISDWLEAQVRKTAERRKSYPPISKIPDFKRELFGSWVNADGPADCFNSRTEALLRDLEPGARVQFDPNDRCRVVEGKWWDPYTNKFLTRSDEVDIDHIVPLQHAYYYGAFKWTPEQRCHYANFLGNDYHLLTVSAHENRSKGADDPRKYMPPNKEFACTYLKMWMKIKMVWDLDVDPQEAVWLAKNAQAFKCDRRQFVMGKREIAEQIMLRQQIPRACTKRMN